MLGLHVDVLCNPVFTWSSRDDYQSACTMAATLTCTNDHAERAVTLVQEFNGKLTAEEEQMQWTLQVVEENRAKCPDTKKATFLKWKSFSLLVALVQELSGKLTAEVFFRNGRSRSLKRTTGSNIQTVKKDVHVHVQLKESVPLLIQFLCDIFCSKDLIEIFFSFLFSHKFD